MSSNNPDVRDLTLRNVSPQDIDALLDMFDYCLKRGMTNNPAVLVALKRKIRDAAQEIVDSE